MTPQKHHTSLLRYLCAKPGGERTDDSHAFQQAPRERVFSLLGSLQTRDIHSIVPATAKLGETILLIFLANLFQNKETLESDKID